VRVGASQRLGHWSLEALTSVWLFTANPDLKGSRVQQDPLWTIQGSVTYVFDGGAWLAVDGGWGSGARATVDGVKGSERQENGRFGVAAAYPLTRRAALKLASVSGLSTRLGADFDSLILLYQYRWGGGL
jgi:hypothetical protein